MNTPAAHVNVDHLLAPENCTLVIIDYQPLQVSSVASMDRRRLVENIVSVARTARLYELRVVLSTLNVKTGLNRPMIHPLAELFAELEPVDRTTLNAWEDPAFVAAIKAAGHSKLVMAGLWTEVCLAFPVLSALRAGFEVFPIVDSVGSTSKEAHKAGIDRMLLAGAQPTSWTQLLCELQRDWNRTDTVGEFSKILFSAEGA